MRSNPPSWCADSWCYVDTDDCDKPFSSSVFFPGLSYSYFTCGASNTFDSWFSTGSGSGEVEDHKLTELVTLMKTYTTTISETLEENFIEATQVRLPPSPKPPAAQPTTTAPPARLPLTPRVTLPPGVGLLSRELMRLCRLQPGPGHLPRRPALHRWHQ